MWDGWRCKRDVAGDVYEAAKVVAATLWAQVPGEHRRGRRKALARWAAKSEAANHIEAMVRLARTAPEVVVEAGELDADPWLLNVANGTVDLRTWGFRMNGTKTSSADWFGERTEYAVSDEIGEVERVPAMQLDVFPDQRR